MRELVLGVTLGFSAGVAPGPLLGLLLTSTLRGGLPAGARVAVAPLVTDLPIIALCITVLAALPQRVVATAAVAGGAFVFWLGVSTVRDARTAQLEPAQGRSGDQVEQRRALLRAIAVNVLNPHPWLFWVGVGGPLLVAAWRTGPGHAAAFLIAFYGLLVGSKAVLAVAVGLGRNQISERWYRRMLAGTGLLLLAAGIAIALQFVPQVV